MIVMLASIMTVALSAQPKQSTEKQTTPAQPTSTAASQAKPEDVQSVDAIIKALYDVISGPAGTRDWSRFQSLFIPEARLTATAKRPDGTYLYRSMTPQEYQERAGAAFAKEAFFESGVHNTVEQFGLIAHVWTTYESRHEKAGQPFARGINSIQLLNDGKRWWIVSILWDSERPDNPIPQKYLK